jgi:tyrosine-protein phosphatase SIW14
MKTACSLALLLCPPVMAAQGRIAQFSRVDNHVYRGRQPKARDFDELAGMGIKTVLDLRGGRFHTPWERKLVEAAGMNYTTIRLSGIWEPKKEQIAKILAVLEDPAVEPVFVHCRRGDDRVGMVIACYRIAHDHWTNEQALKEANLDGISPLEVLMRRYIRHFDPSKLPEPKQAQAGSPK